jgi:hypothetical protein
MIKTIYFILALFLFSSCSTSVTVYKEMNPKMDLEKFFNGRLKAHGLFKNRSGVVQKTFVVEMNASWQNGIGTIKEDFIYNDGTKDQRIWILTKVSDGIYSGRAGDVIGTARGEVSGNALFWDYDLNLKVKEDFYKVHFEDWMFLIDENNIINYSNMSKFGINLGQVILNIKKI